MGRFLTNGAPGDVWTNDTGKVQYQLLVSWHNSCGLCIQWDHAIGSLWPTPFHYGCNCRQKPICPGATGEPFVDFRAEIRKVDRAQQAKIMGRSNLTLVEAGVVKWEDVVTNTRVRTLREVVSREKLSVERMVRSGVVKRLAAEAHAAVNTPAQAIADQVRKQAVEKLRDLGLKDADIKEHFGQRLAERVGIGAGPSKRSWSPPASPATARLLLNLGVKLSAVAKVVKPELEPTPIERAVDYAEARGIDVEPKGHQRFVAKDGEVEAAKIPAAYNGDEGKIYLNEEHPYWADPAGWMQAQHKAGWFSTGNADHIFLHETAHALHHQAVGDEVYKRIRRLRFKPSDAASAATKVGSYAAKKPLEFVAEVFSALATGRSYDDEVMRLYRKLKGPTP